MGIKKVLVVYFGNGDVKNLALKESIMHKLSKEIVDSGNSIRLSTMNKIIFHDGSTIESNPYCVRGTGYTHIYLQDEIKDKLLSVASNTLIASDGKNKYKYDLDGSRIMSFSSEDGELTIKPLN